LRLFERWLGVSQRAAEDLLWILGVKREFAGPEFALRRRIMTLKQREDKTLDHWISVLETACQRDVELPSAGQWHLAKMKAVLRCEVGERVLEIARVVRAVMTVADAENILWAIIVRSDRLRFFGAFFTFITNRDWLSGDDPILVLISDAFQAIWVIIENRAFASDSRELQDFRSYVNRSPSSLSRPRSNVP
jgi:hypothetical protein